MALLGFFGPPNIEKLRAEQDLKGLIKALQYHLPLAADPDWETHEFAHTAQEKKQKEQYHADLAIRQKAAGALGEIGSPFAVEPLIGALADKSPSVRKAAMNALGKLRDPRAFTPLSAFLNDKVWEMRETAGMALAQLGDPRAIEPVIAGLTLKNRPGEMSRVGQMVLENLVGQLNPESLRDALKSPHWALRAVAVKALARTGGSESIEALIEALHDDYGLVRAPAAEALGQLRDTRALNPLITALQDRFEPVRLKALESLLRFGEDLTVEPLLTALKDESTTMRARAADALGQLGDARAIAPLIAALEAGPDVVRIQAIQALKRMGDASAIEPFVQVLAKGPAYWETLADALVELDGGTQAIEPLLAILSRNKRAAFQQKWIADKERILASCQDFIRYLEKLGWPATSQQRAQLAVIEMKWDEVLLYGPDAFEPLAEALAHGSQKAAELLEKQGWVQTDRQRAELAVVKADWPEAVRLGHAALRPLLAAMDRGNPEAVKTLGQLKDPQTVEPLIAALNKFAGQRWMPGAIALALGALGDPRAIKPLLELLDSLYASGEALDGLVEIGGPAIEPLLKLLEGQNGSLRAKAALALGRIKDVQASPALVQALTDSQPDVREAAAQALKELKWKAATISERAQLALARRDWPEAIRLGEARAVIQYLLGVTHVEETLAKSAAKDLGQLLEKTPEVFSLDELRTVAKLKVIGISSGLDFSAGKRWDGESCSYPSIPVEKEIDSSHLRQLARQELIRRGEQT